MKMNVFAIPEMTVTAAVAVGRVATRHVRGLVTETRLEMATVRAERADKVAAQYRAVVSAIEAEMTAVI